MTFRLTPVVKALAIAFVAVFVLQQLGDRYAGLDLLSLFALVPAGVVLEHRFWQLVTYPFLHGDVTHLFLNALMLIFIGSEIEALWGRRRFISFLLFCTVCAGLAYLLLQVFVWGAEGLHTPMLGASGAIYGLLMAYGILFSERSLMFMMVFPMKARQFVWVLAGLEFFTTVFSPRGGLASAAHLAGMVAGLGYLWGWSRLRAGSRARAALSAAGAPVPGWLSRVAKPKRKSSHLKLVVDNPAKRSGGAGGDSADGEGPKGPTFH